MTNNNEQSTKAEFALKIWFEGSVLFATEKRVSLEL